MILEVLEHRDNMLPWTGFPKCVCFISNLGSLECGLENGFQATTKFGNKLKLLKHLSYGI